jgi:hypothetical protein
VFAELLDLQASRAVRGDVAAADIVDLIGTRYEALWAELTAGERFSTTEMWRIEQRIERLNELGFDVDELDISADVAGDQVEIRPRVVELGHHRRELQDLTGMTVEDNQARRLLNDIAAFSASLNLSTEDRALTANRWLNEIYGPVVAMVPPDLRGKLDPPEMFHEVLQHRWTMSEDADHEIDTFVAARDYIDRVLRARPDEAVDTLPPDP